MLRILMATLLTAMLTGCIVSLPSAVDVVPFAARMAKAPFADGVYCALATSETDAVLVESGGENGENNCAAFTWDDMQREFSVHDTRDQKPPITFTPADLGGGLFLIQMHIAGEYGDNKPFSYWLMAGVAHGDAVAILTLPSDERLNALAAQYPSVMLSTYELPSQFTVTPFPSENEGEPQETVRPTTNVTYIAGSTAAEARNFARDVAIQLIGELVAEAKEKNVPLAQRLPMLMRAAVGAADHPVTGAQQRDIDNLISALRKLQPAG